LNPSAALPVAARLSHAHAQQLLDAVDVGLLRTGPDGVVQYANPRAAALLGRQPTALMGLHLLELVHPDDAPGLQAGLEQLLAGHACSLQRQARCHVAGGETTHLGLQFNTTPPVAGDGAGQIGGLAVVLHEARDQLDMADALAHARQSDQASRAKTEFLSRMSHELRTPLNAMLGFAQLLRVDPRHPLTDVQRQKVDHIERAGAHLLAMMTDVLDLSRIEAGSLPLHLQTVAVADLVEEALSMVQHQAAQAQLHLSGHVAEAVVVHPGLAPPPLAVHADPVRLRQALVNLLSNAIKYNRPGGRVLIEAMPIDGEVMFNVSDTGPGLSAEQVSHLFEPFNRLGAEHTVIEGTGIGLVIVRRLAELMQGRVSVSSALGTGSSFKLWLPRATVLAADQATPGPTAPAHDTMLASPPSHLLHERPSPQRTVLYAEDNMINVELVRQVMHMRPHWQLDVAMCGQQAIDMARHRPPDLLLLDMHLGDMSGLDVSDALLSHPATAALPRVALSADAMPDQINEARLRGFAEYLTKPLDVGRFLGLLDQLATPPLRDTAAANAPMSGSGAQRLTRPGR
jgi:PAS domain S-box-containing protein